jgi:chaperonin cofactor prefoldin
MEDRQVQDLLFKMSNDLAVVMSKLDALDEIKIDTKNIGNRVDTLEAKCERFEQEIASLKNRASTMEQFTRDNMNDSKKQQMSVFISLGLAAFSAVLSLVFGLILK